jgi:hypothetical protein
MRINVSQSTTILSHEPPWSVMGKQKCFFFCIVARISEDETIWKSERVVLLGDLFVYTHPTVTQAARPENPVQDSGTIVALQGIAGDVVGPCLSGFE